MNFTTTQATSIKKTVYVLVDYCKQEKISHTPIIRRKINAQTIKVNGFVLNPFTLKVSKLLKKGKKRMKKRNNVMSQLKAK